MFMLLSATLADKFLHISHAFRATLHHTRTAWLRRRGELDKAGIIWVFFLPYLKFFTANYDAHQ